ncbi:MAG: SGNH/GDSL hydrolase family protein [candidate division KSB1 bacterium]|nr:SGNH/GDSL hydrolase family protein [candidate division KSB1 bacterium]
MRDQVISTLIFTALLLFPGCAKNLMMEKDDIKFTYLALGDSYTIGESVDASQRYPVLLTDSLRKAGYPMDDPVIVARTGWTTDELAAGIRTADLSTPYSLVSLLVGVNNQYRGRDVENYRIEFRSLLEQAITFAGGQAEHVFVLSIPDWGVTPFAASRDREQIAGEIDQYNAVNREETRTRGVLYIDITPISRQTAEDPALIADDGLHPSGRMYAACVELALPEIKTILNRIRQPK